MTAQQSTTRTESQSWGFREGDDLTDELRIVRRLGGGASYEAYLAFDQFTFSPVVVKVLRPDMVEDSSSLRGLRREARALAEVNHPVTIRGLRHVADGERPHLVLELADGPRLSSLMRRHGPLSEQQYLPLGIDLAAALHYFGRIGWTHLDLKPSNIIMGAPARLIDLSVARPIPAAALLTVPIGTDAYMAPEQAAPGEFGVPGAASDVWGLGATLRHALTGKRPFLEGDPDHGDLGMRHPQTRGADGLAAPLPPNTPRPVVEVLSAMLDLDPARRPAPAEVSEVFQQVLAVQPVGKLVFKVR